MIKKNFFSIIFLLAVSLLKAQDTTNEYLRIVNEFEKNNREKFNNSDDKIKKHYMRYRTWWDYRLDKHQNIKAYRKVWMDYYKNNSIITSNTNKNLPQMTWEQIGPSDLNLTNKINNVGRCVSVAVDPTNPNIVYIGTSNSGLWKTTNALTNDPKAVQWTCLTDNVSSLGVWSIAIKPDNPDVIFFVGGVRQVNITGGEKYYSLGVFKSTDGGNTFTNILPLNPDDDVAFTQILFHPTNFNIVFLLGDNLLLKSTDGGNTFNLLQGFPDDAQLRQMAINTTNPDEFMIGGYNGSVLYYTNDGGININNIYNPAVFGTNSENLFPAYNPVNGYFYVVYYSGIKKTNNGGNSWETVFTNNPPYQDLTIMSYVTHLAISNNNEIYVGGIKCILFSNDLWVNYLLPSNQIHADVRAVGFSNSANGAPVFIVTDGGVCRNLNGGVYGWESINGNLTISEFYDLDVCISNPEIMLGGTMDCGTLKRNEDGTWLHINGSDGGGTSVNGYNCNYCLSSMGAGPQYLMYSTNGGNSWAYCSDIEPLIKYNTPVFRVPASQDIVYTGVWNLKKSLNNGTNFQSVHDGGGTYVSCIDISPLNPSYISYAEYRNWIEQGMASSLNIYNGQFWYTITAQTTPYPFAQDMEIVPIVDIEFSPIEQNTLFICFGGLEAAGKIYKSTNLGQSWIDITYNLPNIPYTDLEYDSNTNILYLGSDFGVFYLEQNSTTWNKLSGLPDMIISKIKILPELGEIVVATFGRGIFKTSYCTYNSTPLVVNTNQIWSSDKKLFSDLIIDNNSTLTIEKHLFVPDAATITVKNGSTLILNENSILQGACKEYYEGSIIVEPGGRMVLKDNSTVKLAGNGIIYIEDNSITSGTLDFYPDVSIVLHDDNTAVNISGTLNIQPIANFTFTGSGYIKFSSPNWPSNNITYGSGSSITLSGSGQSDKIIEIAQETVFMPNGTLSNGLVYMQHPNARMQAATENTSMFLDNVKFSPLGTTRTQHRGVNVWGNQNCTISNCIFENGQYGIYAYLSYGGASLSVSNCNFTNNTYGMWVHDKSFNSSICTFTKNDYGIYAENTSVNDSKIDNCYFTGNPNRNKYPIRYMNCDGGLSIENSQIFDADATSLYSINSSGNYNLRLYCTTISIPGTSTYALNLANGANLIMSTNTSRSGNCNITAAAPIRLTNAYNINIDNGYNYLNKSGNYHVYGNITAYACNGMPSLYFRNNQWNGTITNLVKNINCSPAQNFTLITNPTATYTSCSNKSLLIENNETTESSAQIINYADDTQDWQAAFNTNAQLFNGSFPEENPHNVQLLENSWENMRYCLKKMYDLKQLHGIANSEFNQTIAVNHKMQQLQRNNYYRLFQLKLEKATLYRMAGNYDKAMELVEELTSDTCSSHKEQADAWLCVLQLEKRISQGLIPPDRIEKERANCPMFQEPAQEQTKSFQNNSSAINIESSSWIKIIPNPASEQITLCVNSESENPCELEITNIFGEHIETISINEGYSERVVPLDKYSKGIYFASLIKNGRKLVIQRFTVVN